MRKLLLLLAVAVALSLPGFAQAGGGQTTTESTSTNKTKAKKSGTAAAVKESQLTGCLAKNAEGNGFMLTNGRYKKGVEVKSSEDISAHVGHEVRLMGTWEKPAAGEKSGAGAKGETMRMFDATSLKHIADTCPAAGATGSHKGGKKGESTPPSK